MLSRVIACQRLSVICVLLCIVQVAVATKKELVHTYDSSLDSSSTDECRISFKCMAAHGTGAQPMAVKAADLNHDSFLDLVVANYHGNTTSIYFGNGDGNFKRDRDLHNGPHAGANDIAIDDINNDHHLDIVVANRQGRNIGVFLGHGNGTFSKQITTFTGNSSAPVGLALGDLNNDTFMDVVVTDHVDGFIHICLGRGNGTFNMIHSLWTGNESGPYSVVINDFNQDKHLDIAVGNGDGNYLGIFLGNGRGSFSEQIIHEIEGGPYALVTADFNDDGILDIITANYYGNSTSVLFGNGNGTFREKRRFSTGDDSLPYAIALGDFDNDDIQDIIVPNSGTDNVAILLGYGKGKFRRPKMFSTGIGSGPTEITVGDFNQDNRLDFVSVNHNHDTIGIFLSTCQSD